MVLREVLSEVRQTVEERIRQELSGLGGLMKRAIYNSRMPLHVQVLTNNERAELLFLNDGCVELRDDPSPNPDVTIDGDIQTLQRIVSGGGISEFKQLESLGRIRITAHTERGREAESYIRGILDL